MARADIEELVSDIVQDDSRLRAGAMGRAIDEAVRRYSKDRPRLIIDILPGTGRHLIDAPAGWEEGSRIVAAEWPADQDPPSIRRPGDVVPYDHPEGVKLMFRLTPPAIGETARVTFTAAHRLSAFDDTVPAADCAAVAYLAASLLLEQLAVATAGDTDSTIPADAVDHKTTSDRYAARARAARKIYDDHLGGAADGAVLRPVGAAAEVGLPAGRRGLLRGGA